MPAVLFVDPRVQDLPTLFTGFAPSIEVILLDTDRDGINQMAKALFGSTGLDAIHDLSHGTQGLLQLGNAWIDNGNLNANQNSAHPDWSGTDRYGRLAALRMQRGVRIWKANQS